jgi:hypothetical protein
MCSNCFVDGLEWEYASLNAATILVLLVENFLLSSMDEAIPVKLVGCA